MNAIILSVFALLWSLVSAFSQIRSSFHKGSSIHDRDNERSFRHFWEGLGSAVLVCWLVRITLTPPRLWNIFDLISVSWLAAGFWFLLKRPTVRAVKTNETLEILPNHFGVFHVRLNGDGSSPPAWEGRTLGELDLRKRNLLVLAITRQDKIIPFPKGQEKLAGGDDLLIFGSLSELSR